MTLEKSDVYYSKANPRAYGITTVSIEGTFVWPHLVNGKPFKEKDGTIKPNSERFEVEFLFEKGTPEAKVFGDAVRQQADVLLEVYNEHQTKQKMGAIEVLFEDGDKKNLDKYPFYKNKWSLIARLAVDKKVEIYNSLSGETVEAGPDFVKGGMEGRIIFQPHLGPTGLSFKLEGVEVTKDSGQRFGGGGRDLKAILTAAKGTPVEALKEAVSAPITEASAGKKAVINKL